jgi:hypothetical protein
MRCESHYEFRSCTGDAFSRTITFLSRVVEADLVKGIEEIMADEPVDEDDQAHYLYVYMHLRVISLVS